MKPYYDEDGIQIFLADCREVIPTLPKVDLVLTDPPYGIGFDRENTSMSCGMRVDGSFRVYNSWKSARPKGYETKDWDQHKISTDAIDLIFKAADAQIIWGGNYYHFPISGGWLVWDKQVTMTSLSKCELAWSSVSEHIEIFRYLWAGYRKEIPEERYHPTQKPLSLMKWCLSLPSTRGFRTILDPFMGVGTTLVAAKDLGLKAIGIEIEEKYAEIAANRLRQGVLFGAKP